MAAITRLRLNKQDLREGERIHKEVHGRTVTVVKTQGNVYCIDAACYHMGGPLGQGDIEDFCGVPTIQCPWHGHRISLANGSFVDKDLYGKPCEKHGQQRVHKVYVDPDGSLSIAIDNAQWVSDKYNNPAMESQQPAGGRQGHRGYGLGSFAPAAPVAGPTADSDDDMADDMAISSQPEPLIPYGGLDKYYLPPSPMKLKQPPHSASKAEGARPTMPQTFRGRKLSGMSHRGAAARNAVLNNQKAPPMAPQQQQQRTLTDFFQPIGTAPQLHMGEAAMEM